MDETNKTEGAEGKSCCGSKGKCCGCKALGAVALLLVGGAAGYFCGHHCAVKTEAPAAVTAPAPAK